MHLNLVYRQVDFSNNLASKFLISALSSVAVATATLRLLDLCNLIRRQVSGIVISKTMY